MSDAVVREGIDLRTTLVVACATAVSDMSFSTIAPYYPTFAQNERGVSPSAVGLIFSTTQITALLVTPVAPRIIQVCGSTKSVLQQATIVQAILNLLWAFTDRLEGTVQFVIVCVVLRALQGIAMSLTETAASSMAMRSAPPDRVGEALGYVEAARGLGIMLGPLLGGILFRVGGYWAPGVASAALIFVVGLMTFTVSTPGVSGGTGATGRVSLRELCGEPCIVTNSVMIAVSMVGFSFLDPTLAPYLEAAPYNLSSDSVGLVFSFASVSYALCSVFVSPIAQKTGETGFVVLGRILLGGVFLLLGPSPLLPFLPQNVYFFSGTMVLLGVVVGAVMVPGQTLMTAEASRIRGPDTEVPTEEFSDSLSALSNVAFTSGAILGPLVAGALTQFTDFAEGSTLVGFFLSGLAVLSAPILCRRTSSARMGEELLDGANS